MSADAPFDAAHTHALGKQPCAACGGDMEWNAARQALVCPFCGGVAAWTPPPAADPAAGAGEVGERDLAAALADPTATRGWGEARQEVKCESCHAISVFVGHVAATRCEFCGSPKVLPHEAAAEAITPQALLPFKISDGQVRDLIRRWYGTRWFAPNRLKTAALTDTLRGVYLPYWTFDAHVDARWTAEAGHYYYVPETYTDSQGRTQTRMKRHVRWVPAAGELQHFFDDALVPGTTGVHGGLLRQVEPFPTTTELRPYAAEFVRGWTVERYQVDLARAAEANLAELQQRTRALCSAEVPGDTQRNLQVDARFDGRSFKHVLVPVWLVAYTYGSRSYQVLANGYTGQLAGEHPYSWVKIALAVAGALAALGAIAAAIATQQG